MSATPRIGSIIDHLAALDPGKCYTRSVRITGDVLDKAEIQSAKARFMRDTPTYLRRAQARTGHAYNMLTVAFLTDDLDVVVSCVVTRTA